MLSPWRCTGPLRALVLVSETKEHALSTDDLSIALTFACYLALMLGIGVFAYRRTADLSDFVLGGRRLGSWVAALSASASDMSGWLLLGLPGYAYTAGLESAWLAGGLLAGTWLNWRLMAARLRVYSEVAGQALTLPEFFARRFRDESGALRIIAAVFILLFFLFYTSSPAVLVLPAVMIGGFLAVSWTDLVQGLLMAGALVAVPLMAISDSGGITELFRDLHGTDPHRRFDFVSARLLPAPVAPSRPARPTRPMRWT